MLRDITIGQHFPGDSLVHRFDPRLKLVLTIAYIVLLFAASNPLGLALSILFLAVMYKVAKIPGKMILKSLKPILPIVIFTAVLNLFFVSGEGEPLVHIWFLTIYAEGVRYAVLMAVRVMALIPLFISAFRRADELAMAMECRCYRGGDGRTRLKVLRCEKQDYIDLAVCIACFAVILASRLVFPNF